MSKEAMRRLALVALAAAMGSGCGDGGAATGPARGPATEVAAAAPFVSQIVEAACGECQFGMEGDGCDLAVRIGDRAWFVDGTRIDEHGDAHAADGFCNAIRQARVSGTAKGERFEVTAFELIEVAGG